MSPSTNTRNEKEAVERLQQLRVELWAAVATWAAFPAEAISVAKQKAVVAFEQALERYATAHVLNAAHVHGVVAESVRKTLEQLRVDQEIVVKHPKAPASDRSDERFAAGALTTRVMIALERNTPLSETPPISAVCPSCKRTATALPSDGFATLHGRNADPVERVETERLDATTIELLAKHFDSRSPTVNYSAQGIARALRELAAGKTVHARSVRR